jgi:hypothetical protein
VSGIEKQIAIIIKEDISTVQRISKTSLRAAFERKIDRSKMPLLQHVAGAGIDTGMIIGTCLGTSTGTGTGYGTCSSTGGSGMSATLTMTVLRIRWPF